MDNKVVYVRARFKPLGRMKTVKVPTGEKKKGIFGQEKDVMIKKKEFKPNGLWSNCEIDGEQLAVDVQTKIAHLTTNGYEIISITPITSGKYNSNHKIEFRGIQNTSGAGYGYGYGYSYTEGLIIIARRTSV